MFVGETQACARRPYNMINSVRIIEIRTIAQRREEYIYVVIAMEV